MELAQRWVGCRYEVVGRVFQVQGIIRTKGSMMKTPGCHERGLWGGPTPPEMFALEFSLWNLGSAATGLMPMHIVHKAE